MTSLLLLKSMLMANALSKSKKKKKKLMLRSKPIKRLQEGVNMCRICNEEDGEIPIFNNIVHPNLSEEIHNFSGVKVENSDGLPNHMCQNCLNLLNGCIMFREMCQKTNKKIIEIRIKKETNVESTTDYDNYPEYNDIDQQPESDSSYNIPSPNYIEECSEIRCTYCDKEFTDLATYSSHIKQCHREEPRLPKKFLCDVCGKTAKSRANLVVHKLTHENIFPFECDKCPYKGRTIDLLKVHKKSHLSEAELPFRCSKCPKATTTASNLSAHMRTTHSNRRSNAYKCTYCEKTFSFQHDMKRHIREIHLRQGTVECDICFKRFNTKKILRGHQYRIHKVKSERQGRLPSYLQVQLETCDTSANNNMEDNEPHYLE